MKSLSRGAIQRMTGGASGASRSGSTGGGTVDLTGYATEIWTEEHYINKEFFSSLFKAYDVNGNEVLPNDTETVVSNIKAMFGFWTDFYLSALGIGQVEVGIRLSQLKDVDVTGVDDGQALIYNRTLGKWVPGNPTHGTVTSVGMSVPTGLKVTPAAITSSGTFSIAFDTGYSIPLTTDVNKGITAYGWGNHASQGYATQTWVNSQISDMATQTWVNSQISDMATKTWVNSQISDMATKTWANGQFLKLSGGEMTGAIIREGVAFQTPTGTRQLHISDSYTILGYDNDSKGLDTYIDGRYIYLRTSSRQTVMTIGNDGNVTVDGLLKISANNNSVTIGSQNNTFCHIYNSANIPFIFNKAVWTMGAFMPYNGHYDIGDSSNYWGTAYVSNIYSMGYVTALSDARHKNVIGDTGLTVEQIAEAPAIRFTWKDRDDQSVFAGSIAQYWQKVLPEVVQSQADGTLSLDYQVAALISSITVAREVVSLKKTISDLEARLRRFEQMFAINENDIED